MELESWQQSLPAEEPLTTMMIRKRKHYGDHNDNSDDGDCELKTIQQELYLAIEFFGSLCIPTIINIWENCKKKFGCIIKYV